MSDGVAPGIRRKNAGFQAYLQVAGRLHTKVFPLGTAVKTMQAWRAATRREFGGRPSLARGRFDVDARRYLQAVAALPTFKERQKHIEEWIAVFGFRQRDTITAAEIQTHREALVAQGYAPQSVNLRLRALSNLWTVLDGRRAPNPVREVPEVDPRDDERRSLPWTLAQRLIEALPDQGQGLKGQPRSEQSKTKARLRVMIWTGLPAASLQRLSRSSVDWTAGALYAPGRRKGKRPTKPRLKPLNNEALLAFRALDAIDGWGAFSTSSVYKTFRRATQRVIRDILRPGPPSEPDRMLIAMLERARPYDIRHTYASALLRASNGNLSLVGQALSHSSPKLTERYAREALDEAMVAAETRLAELGRGLITEGNHSF